MSNSRFGKSTPEERAKNKEKRARDKEVRDRERLEQVTSLFHDLDAAVSANQLGQVNLVPGKWKQYCLVASNNKDISAKTGNGFFSSKFRVSFFRGENAIGRANYDLPSEVVEGIMSWLQEGPSDSFYKRFPEVRRTFIEERIQTVLGVGQKLVTLTPSLNDSFRFHARNYLSEHDTLVFTHENRECFLPIAQNMDSVGVSLRWDKRELCRFQGSNLGEVSTLIARWICAQALPSQLKLEFPGLEVEEISTDYEQGRGWEAECLASWAQVRALYLELFRGPLLNDTLLPLLDALESRGYDRTLRAGMSVASLVLSRSLAHGLEDGQPLVSFWFLENGYHIVVQFDKYENRKTFDVEGWEITPQIEGWLKELESFPPN